MFLILRVNYSFFNFLYDLINDFDNKSKDVNLIGFERHKPPFIICLLDIIYLSYTNYCNKNGYGRMSTTYILSLRRILELDQELNEEYVKYSGADIFDEFNIEQIYRFIINEIPPKLLKTITSFTFINDVNPKIEFDPHFGDAIRMNPLPGFSDEDMYNIFTRYIIINVDPLSVGGGELDANHFKKVIFHVKSITKYIAEILNLLSCEIIGIKNSESTILDSKRYISVYLYLEELYKNYRKEDEEHIKFAANQKNLLLYLNEKLYSLFISDALDFQKVFIQEQDHLAFKRLYPHLFLKYGADLVVRDLSEKNVDNLKNKVYWFKNVQELSYEEQLLFFDRIRYNQFSDKLIIVSSKVLPDESVLKPVFNKNIFKTSTELSNIENISQVFFYLLLERYDMIISDFTESLIHENKFKPIFNDLKSFAELEKSVQSIGKDFDFQDINSWEMILGNVKSEKIMKFEKQKVEEEEKQLSQFQFIRNNSGTFKIVFAGKDIILPDMKMDGLLYIRAILRFGNQPNGIQAIDLYGLKTGKNQLSKPQRSAIRKAIEIDYEGNSNGEVNLPSDNKRIKLTDEISLNDTKETIKILLEEKEKYGEDPLIVKEIDIKLEKLYDYIKKSTNHKGQIKKVSPQIIKDFRKVYNAIDTAYKHILVGNKDFYDYLDKSIELLKGKYSYKYHPQKSVDWLLD